MLHRFVDCELDTARFELRRGGQPVEVEPQVLKLLIHLVENRDRVVTRAELNKIVWQQRGVSDGALNTRVKTARRLVGDDGRSQAMIKTVHRQGYRFVADVDSVAVPELSAHSRSRLAISLEPNFPALAAAEVGDPGQPSLVVLPLETLGDADGLALLARGLTQDLTTRLARTRALFVIAHGTACRFDSPPYDVRVVGDMLGVRYVVQGSVQIDGKGLKATVSLASAAKRQEIWSEQYRCPVTEFLRSQEEVAQMIAGVVAAEVERSEQRRSLLLPSSSLDAWSAFHRGCWHMYRFRAEDLDEAERWFRLSITREPTLPRPYAGLSFVDFTRAFLDIAPDRSAAMQRAIEYGLRSTAVDPRDAMGHWALGRAHLLAGDLGGAETALNNAIELNPSYASAHYSLGWVHMQAGEHGLCHGDIAAARRLSPFDPLTFAMLGVGALNLAMMGKADEACELSLRSVQQPNAHYLSLIFAAVSLALGGRRSAARDLLSRGRAQRPNFGAADFLRTFRFKHAEDARLIRDAFNSLRSVN
jgi:TolB-like protein